MSETLKNGGHRIRFGDKTPGRSAWDLKNQPSFPIIVAAITFALTRQLKDRQGSMSHGKKNKNFLNLPHWLFCSYFSQSVQNRKTELPIKKSWGSPTISESKLRAKLTQRLPALYLFETLQTVFIFLKIYARLYIFNHHDSSLFQFTVTQELEITAVFNNMRTLKFKPRPNVRFTFFVVVNHLGGFLGKQNFTSTGSKGHFFRLWLVYVDFDPFYLFLFFKVRWLSP